MQLTTNSSAPTASELLTFGDVLSPLHVSTFVSEYWGKRPLYIKGTAHKFGDLFSIRDLECLAQSKGEVSRMNVPCTARASFDRGVSHIRVDLADAMALYAAGATLCFRNINSLSDNLASFSARVRQDLGFLGKVDLRAYLSPDGQGFDTHFDARVATTLQVEGRKRWRYSNEVAIDWPHYQVTPGGNGTLKVGRALNAWEVFRPVEECSFEEVILEPGDVLCLPAGTWHSAEAAGYSLALNLAFSL